MSPGADLEEMQSLFFYVEEGDAYDKLGKLNLALKRYHGLEKVCPFTILTTYPRQANMRLDLQRYMGRPNRLPHVCSTEIHGFNVSVVCASTDNVLISGWLTTRYEEQ